MPWKAMSGMVQHLSDLAMVTGISGSFGYFAVGGNFAARDAEDGGANGGYPFVRLCSHPITD